MKFLSTTICVLLLLNVSHAQILSENPADGLLCINGAIPFWTACDEDKCADTSYYTNGAIKLIGSCGNGIKEGTWKAFYENGNLMATGEIVESLPNGLWNFYYENGQKYAEGAFVKGNFELGCMGSQNYMIASCKTGTWQLWHPNGLPWQEYNYRINEFGEQELHGDYLAWSANGNLEEQGHYYLGMQDGLWTTWDNLSGAQYMSSYENFLEAAEYRAFNEHPEILEYEIQEFHELTYMDEYLTWLAQDWDSVPNPLVVKYDGNFIGDYFHLIFTDSVEAIYDFGFGNNNFDGIQLFEGEHYTDNEAYLGKTFKITWGWKHSVFPCCDGDYNRTEQYQPSIIKLEILEE